MVQTLPKELLLNAVSSKAGGGLNDLLHTVPLLVDRLILEGWRSRVYVAGVGSELLFEEGACGTYLRTQRTSPIERMVWEYVRLPALVRRETPQVVFHFSNFIPRDLPIPQITVLRNVAYFSDAYRRQGRVSASEKLRYALGVRLSRQTVKRAAAVYCLSHAQREAIIQTLGAVGEKVEVTYPGVEPPANAAELADASRSSVLVQMPVEFRQKLSGLLNGRPVILNVAHYYSQKNLGDLLRAVDLLRHRMPGVLLIITAGLCRHREEANRTRRREIELAHRLADAGVLIDLGPVPKSVVWMLLAVSDVFAFPSSVESFGHPLLEAMCLRRPVVASDTTIHREVCGDAAVFYRLADFEELAARLEEVLSGSDARERLVERGLARAREFSWKRHVDTLCDGIRRVASSS